MSDAVFPSRRGLTGDALKLLAILAMTLDHIAWLLFPGYPAQAMPLAAPLHASTINAHDIASSRSVGLGS